MHSNHTNINIEKPVLQVHACQSRNQPSAHHSKDQSCHRCGGSHDAAKCQFRQAECHFCHKKGHIASVCRQKAKRQSKPGTRSTHMVTEKGEATLAKYPMYQCHSTNSKLLSVQMIVQDASVCMEVNRLWAKAPFNPQSAPTIRLTNA